MLSLDALTREIEALTPAQRAKVAAPLKDILAKQWLPVPGPQTEAYLSDADILLYGGAAGGGKSDLLLGLALNEHQQSVIFRRAFVDIRGLETRLLQITGSRDGWNGQDKVLRTADRLIEFGALEKPGAEESWQGRPHDLVAFDEGAQLTEAKVKYVLGWLRSATGRRCRAVIASNPPLGADGEWLREWFAPWLDPAFPNPARPGELRWCINDEKGKTRWVEGPGAYPVDGYAEPLIAKSRTFIPAGLADNPFLRDTDYRAQLMQLDEPMRSKLLNGDWNSGREDDAWQVIPTAWVDAAIERWSRGRENKPMTGLGVDVAQGGPDDTTLAPLHGDWFDMPIIKAGVDTKDGPAVAALIVQTRRDRAVVSIDCTGGWGGSAADHLKAQGVPVLRFVASAGTVERTRPYGDMGFLNRRAEMWWRMREALDPKGQPTLALPPHPRLRAELCAPRWTLKGAKIVIEMKDDLRKRLGRSTDVADAYVQANADSSAAGLMINRAAAPSYAEPFHDPDW